MKSLIAAIRGLAGPGKRVRMRLMKGPNHRLVFPTTYAHRSNNADFSQRESARLRAKRIANESRLLMDENSGRVSQRVSSRVSVSARGAAVLTRRKVNPS